MVNEENHDVPKTVGELRRRLAEMGDPWQVHPSLSDDDPLPDPPRGGLRDEDTPAEHRLLPLAADSDVRVLIASERPANPFLQDRWAEAGLISRDDAPRVSLSGAEDVEDFGGAA